MEKLLNKTRKFIGKGSTAKAIKLLIKHFPNESELILHNGRFNETERQYRMNQIDYETYSRTKAQINLSLLEWMANGDFPDDESGSSQEPPTNSPKGMVIRNEGASFKKQANIQKNSGTINM